MQFNLALVITINLFSVMKYVLYSGFIKNVARPVSGLIVAEPEPQSPPFPTTWIVAATAIIVVVGAALLVYLTKIRKTTEKPE